MMHIPGFFILAGFFELTTLFCVWVCLLSEDADKQLARADAAKVFAIGSTAAVLVASSHYVNW